MSLRRAALPLAAALLLACCLARASAQPCIECKDCRTGNCWQVCRPTCPRPRPPVVRPNNVIVNGDACRRAGDASGNGAARSACETARRYCNGGSAPSAFARGRGIGPTTLSQCSNIALGSCQQAANDRRRSPCGRELTSGFRQCSASQFRQFYEGETRDLCTNAARSITGVNPGTNQWAG